MMIAWGEENLNLELFEFYVFWIKHSSAAARCQQIHLTENSLLGPFYTAFQILDITQRICSSIHIINLQSAVACGSAKDFARVSTMSFSETVLKTKRNIQRKRARSSGKWHDRSCVWLLTSSLRNKMLMALLILQSNGLNKRHIFRSHFPISSYVQY